MVTHFSSSKKYLVQRESIKAVRQEQDDLRQLSDGVSTRYR